MTVIDFSASGRYPLAQPDEAMRIRVTQLALTSTLSSVVKFLSGDEVIAGPFYLDKSTALVLPWTQNGWFDTLEPGDELFIDISMSAGSAAGGVFRYGML